MSKNAFAKFDKCRKNVYAKFDKVQMQRYFLAEP